MTTPAPMTGQTERAAQPGRQAQTGTSDSAAFQQLLQLLGLALLDQRPVQVQTTGEMSPKTDVAVTVDGQHTNGSAGDTRPGIVLVDQLEGLQILAAVASSGTELTSVMNVIEGNVKNTTSPPFVSAERGLLGVASLIPGSAMQGDGVTSSPLPASNGNEVPPLSGRPLPTPLTAGDTTAGVSGLKLPSTGQQPGVPSVPPQIPLVRAIADPTIADSRFRSVMGPQAVNDELLTADRTAATADVLTAATTAERPVKVMLELEAAAGDARLVREQPPRKSEGAESSTLIAASDQSQSRTEGAVQRVLPASAVREAALELQPPPQTTSVRVDVQPADLGRVRLHVALADNTIHANVVAERPEMQDFLARNFARLESGLQAHGLGIGGFQVEVQGQGRDRPDLGWGLPRESTREHAVVDEVPPDPPAAGSHDRLWDDRRLNVFV